MGEFCPYAKCYVVRSFGSCARGILVSGIIRFAAICQKLGCKSIDARGGDQDLYVYMRWRSPLSLNSLHTTKQGTLKDRVNRSGLARRETSFSSFARWSHLGDRKYDRTKWDTRRLRPASLWHSYCRDSFTDVLRPTTAGNYYFSSVFVTRSYVNRLRGKSGNRHTAARFP